MHAAQVSVNRDTDDDVIMPGVGQEAGLVKRERFVTSVTCPVCALNGSATWVENESVNLETTIWSLSYGFRICPGNEVRLPRLWRYSAHHSDRYRYEESRVTFDPISKTRDRRSWASADLLESLAATFPTLKSTQHSRRWLAMQACL
jgi:hypothetical protein